MKTTKICANPDCVHQGKSQSVDNFYKDSSRKDGLSSRCKDCIRLRNKKYLEDHREENRINCHNYYEKNKEVLLEQQHQYGIENKEKIAERSKQYREIHKKEKSEADRKYRNSPAKYDLFFERLSKYDECRCDPENLELLQVRCKNHNCQKWFNPTNDQVHHRLTAINSINMGEANFYCSDECKNTCPLYGLRYDPNEKDADNCTRDDNLQKELREMVFELDNYTCQMCGRSPNEYPDLVLHCHHIIPRAKELMFSADIDNCVTLCSKCHILAHKNPECTYANLRRKVE